MISGVRDDFDHGMMIREFGPPDAVARIVYLHGLGESGLCFSQLTRQSGLSAVHHVIPDLPGYGRSPWPTQPESLSGLAKGLVDWLRDRGLRPIFVGHSMGGVVALLVAEIAPDVVRGIVNVDGNVSADDCTFSGRAAAMTEAEFVESGFQDLRERVFSGSAEQPALAGYWASLRLADPRSFYRHAVELVAESRGGTLAGRLAAIEMPLRYVAGWPDGASVRSLELLDRAGVEVVRVEPAGHWPFIDRPSDVADAVISVLAAAF